MVTKSFAEYERESWEKKAAVYADVSLPSTVQAFQPIVDSLADLSAKSVLEIACGTGHLAQILAAQGAYVTGVDIAHSMVKLAAQRAPQATFVQANGEAMPFDDATFDVVVCCFGLLHMPDPQKSMNEAARVLKPGGEYRFSVWRRPVDASTWFGLGQAHYREFADMSVEVPEAPDMFQLADPTIHTAMLQTAGFGAPRTTELDILRPAPVAEDAADSLLGGGIRAGMIFKAQSPERQVIIKRELVKKLQANINAGNAGMPSPAVLVSATKS